MKRTSLLILALVMVCMTVGCEKKFTQKRFDHMVANGQSKMEVEKILGKPDVRFDNEWRWTDKDTLDTGMVVFDENGRVYGKKWSDDKRQDPDPRKKFRKGDWPVKGQGEKGPQSGKGSSSSSGKLVNP